VAVLPKFGPRLLTIAFLGLLLLGLGLLGLGLLGLMLGLGLGLLLGLLCCWGCGCGGGSRSGVQSALCMAHTFITPHPSPPNPPNTQDCTIGLAVICIHSSPSASPCGDLDHFLFYFTLSPCLHLPPPPPRSGRVLQVTSATGMRSWQAQPGTRPTSWCG